MFIKNMHDGGVDRVTVIGLEEEVRKETLVRKWERGIWTKF